MSSVPAPQPALQFGDLVLTGDDVLRSREHTRQLPQQLARLLRALAQADGAIVSKAELLEKCWGRDRGSEQTLAKAISDLRELLPISGAICIETAYGRGYRLRSQMHAAMRLTDRDRAHAICLSAAHRVHQPDRESLLAGARLYELAATTYDLRSPEARIGFAEAQLLLMTAGYVTPERAWPKARRALTEALDLQANLAAVHALHAYGLMSVEWNFRAAATRLADARRLAPLAFSSNYYSGWLNLSLGQSAQAVESLLLAIDSEPTSVSAAGMLGYALLCSGDLERARDAVARPLDLEPENPISQAFYCWIEATVGDPARACGIGALALRRLENSPTSVLMYAYALARAGARDESRRLLVRTRDHIRSEYGCDSLASICWLALGDAKAALASLHRAHRERCCWLPVMLNDPRSSPLHGESDFEKVRRDVLGVHAARIIVGAAKSPADGRNTSTHPPAICATFPLHGRASKPSVRSHVDRIGGES